MGAAAGLPRQDLCTECDGVHRLTAVAWLADERYRHRKHTYRINFANALSQMKNNLVLLFLHTSPLDLCWRLLQRMADAVVAVKPGRAYPRNLKQVCVPGFQQQYRRPR